MIRRLLIVGAAAVALSVAACDRNNEDPGSGAPTPSAAATPEAPPPPAAPPPVTDASAPAFVAKAAASDIFEIAAARLAATKATDPKVKAFAEMMIRDHTRSTTDLKAAIASSGQTINLPETLPADLQAKYDDLSKLAPADFDKAYMSGQVDAHQAALNLLQGYAEAGDTAAIRAFAAPTVPVVQKHLDEARALRDGLK
jgi:putative membrane protein